MLTLASKTTRANTPAAIEVTGCYAKIAGAACRSVPQHYPGLLIQLQDEPPSGR